MNPEDQAEDDICIWCGEPWLYCMCDLEDEPYDPWGDV